VAGQGSRSRRSANPTSDRFMVTLVGFGLSRDLDSRPAMFVDHGWRRQTPNAERQTPSSLPLGRPDPRLFDA
jgi:hypothetical protein